MWRKGFGTSTNQRAATQTVVVDFMQAVSRYAPITLLANLDSLPCAWGAGATLKNL